MDYFLLNGILLFFFSAFFGSLLKIEDLVVDDKLRLIKYTNIIPFITSGLAILMLYFSSFHTKLVWLSIIFSWIIRGKIDHYYHGIVIGLILIFYIFFQNIIFYYKYFFNLFYLITSFSIVGFVHDQVKIDYRLKIKKNLPPIKKFFLHHIWFFWSIILIIYNIYFYFDYKMFISIIGFLAGYTFFYTKHSKKILILFKQKI
ncbi:MAG: hypothetical protein QW156_01930 [Candidatus Aenigmatarchaeota archaeon]